MLATHEQETDFGFHNKQLLRKLSGQLTKEKYKHRIEASFKDQSHIRPAKLVVNFLILLASSNLLKLEF